MTSTISPVFKELKQYDKINVIDVGSARASFLVELEKFFDLKNVYAIGIDPIDYGVESHYDKFYRVCLDDVKTPQRKIFYNDDQSSSLFSSKGEEIGFIDILNINSIIDVDFPEEIIHFIKIDAEGKDLSIVKSLSKQNLNRIKFIAIECPNKIPRYDGEYIKKDCIDYFDSINFEFFYEYDTTIEPWNKSDLSDVVFINKREL